MADNDKMTEAEIKKVEQEYLEQEKYKKYRSERDKKIEQRFEMLEKQNKQLLELLLETKELCYKTQQEQKKSEGETSCFEGELRLTSMLRRQEESRKLYSLKYQADMFYSEFKLWCLAKNPIINSESHEIDMQGMVNECFRNEKLFKQFCDTVKPSFDGFEFWIKKHIAETYFGYEYTFNNESKTWRATKAIK